MDVMSEQGDKTEKQTLERVKGLLFLRQAAVLVSLAVILVAHAEEGVFQTKLLPTYLLLVLVCLVNLAYLVLVGRIRHMRRFAAVQIGLDVVFASILIYLNGAGESNITFLYFACILAASSILGLRAGVMTASAATAALAAIKTLTFFAGYYGWELPWVNPPELSSLKIPGISSGVAYLMAQAIAYYLVAVLAGRLAGGLNERERLNEKILGNITDAVLVVDNDHRVRSINPKAMRLLGLPDDAGLVGKTVSEMIECSVNAEVLRRLFKGRQPGVSARCVSGTLVTTDRQAAPVAITTSPLRDERGRKVGLVVMFADLTERKRLEEALARAETMETVGQLAASIAHEIRNPLACIRGSAQEIRTELAADNETGQLLDLVVRESDRINTIVTDFLHFSKMRRAALAPCNLTDVLSDVVTMLGKRSQATTCDARGEGGGSERGAAVSIEFDDTEPVSCLGDVEQLRQVFLNLGLNALDAMSQGGKLTVSVRQEDALWPSDAAGGECPRVAVEFTDEGEGMTGKVKAQIFKPFFTTKPRGTGLGLAIVHRIVEAHGGHVEADATPGRGSTFRVVLKGTGSVESVSRKPETGPQLASVNL